VSAGKVALLSKSAQAEIARRIETGERPAQVVSEYLAARSSGDELGRSFDRLLTTIKREAPRLKGRLGEISPGRLQRALGMLKDAGGDDPPG
jgi:transposase